MTRKQITLTVSNEYMRYIVKQAGHHHYHMDRFGESVNKILKEQQHLPTYIDREMTVSVPVSIDADVYERITSSGMYSGARSVYDALNYSRMRKQLTTALQGKHASKKQVTLTVSEGFQKHVVLNGGFKVYHPEHFAVAISKIIRDDIVLPEFIETDSTYMVQINMGVRFLNKVTDGGAKPIAKSIYAHLNYIRPSKRTHIVKLPDDLYSYITTLGNGDPVEGIRLLKTMSEL